MADEIEIPVTQPVLLLVLSPVHGLLRRCMQGAENRTLEPVTSIRLKIEESWYASMDCKVQKSGPWVCFYGGHSTGYKLGHHPKNIEPCAHRARTVRAPCAHRATTPPLCVPASLLPGGRRHDAGVIVGFVPATVRLEPGGLERSAHAQCNYKGIRAVQAPMCDSVVGQSLNAFANYFSKMVANVVSHVSTQEGMV